MFLIIEVADTTLRYGIPEVWLIDVEGRTLTIPEAPADGRYRDERRVDPNSLITPKALPGIEVDLSQLF